MYLSLGPLAGLALPVEGLAHHVEPVLRNTRGEVIGSLRVAGELRFH